MSYDEFLEGRGAFGQILEEIYEMHARKSRDYGRDEDPFANVRASEEWGIPGWVGALVRGHDKTKRLQAYLRNGRLANEGVRDSLLDRCVYDVIALLLWDESHQQST